MERAFERAMTRKLDRKQSLRKAEPDRRRSEQPLDMIAAAGEDLLTVSPMSLKQRRPQAKTH